MHQTEHKEVDIVSSFLELASDGSVTIFSGKVELGTGVTTALIQIVADELGVSPESIRVVMGDTALTPNQGGTVGSKTVQVAGDTFRRVSFAAREELIDRAAERLEIAVEDLTIEDGVVRPVDSSVPGVPISELAGEPLHREVPGSIDASAVQKRQHVGTSTSRVDLLAKLTGGRAYLHDLHVPGMLHGRIIRPPVRTMDGAGHIVHVDDREARRMPGVIDVIRNGDFLGVVAEREEQAIRAAEAVQVSWEKSGLQAQDALFDDMRMQPSHDTEPLHRGDVDEGLISASRILSATYRFPIQAHASLGPSCAVADVRDGEATIYSSSQDIYGLRRALAPLLGLEEDHIRLIFREGAGCYGHNGADDVAADAALLSQAIGRPVRVQWSRMDEFAWEPKSPAMLIDMSAGIDDNGRIVSWDHTVWTATHSTRPFGQPGNLLAGQQISPPMPGAVPRALGGDRNAATTYTFPNERVTMHWLADSPLRPSAFRSLGGFNNTTANEVFIDEIAATAGIDPVEMRLRHLDDPRAVDVIEAAAEHGEWGTPPESIEGHLTGRGFAYVRYETEYAYVALTVDVAVDPSTGIVRVTRLVVAHDCGLIINPDGVRNQVEGNIIQGISRSLLEQVTWDDHEVTSLTWKTYPILTFPDIPKIEVILIDQPHEPSWGAGEPAICPVAAAISNAIFDAAGVRLRDVPFSPERVRAALEATL